MQGVTSEELELGEAYTSTGENSNPLTGNLAIDGKLGTFSRSDPNSDNSVRHNTFTSLYQDYLATKFKITEKKIVH